MTTSVSSQAKNLSLQNCGKRCITAQRRVIFISILYAITVFVCIGAVVFSYNQFQPVILNHPDFDSGAVSGTPVVDAKYGFSTLTVQEGYSIQLCGAPAFDGENLHLNLTNPKENNVWFRAEILDANGKILYSTGVLKPDEHLPVMQFDNKLDGVSSLKVHIVGYTPNTWHSAGNVNLELALNSNN